MPSLRYVLVVDDSPQCGTLMSLAVQVHGVSRVEHEADSTRAAARVRDERPDLVLLDIKMPIMDGFDVLKAIRKTGNLVPIVMCSGSSLQADIDRAFEAGCNGYVSKPDSLEGYRDLAGSIIDYWTLSLAPVIAA